MITKDAKLAEKVGYHKRCGYWEVGDTYFFNKLECLRYASKLGNYNVKYHFYDSAYKSLNWSIEPSQSLKQLYKNRAQQLRDSYDYLILSFSGGSDSTNILKTFIDNGIKLDEIYCEFPTEAIENSIRSFTQNRNDPTQIIYEWVAAAKPMLKTIAQYYPQIKITIESSTQEYDLVATNCEIYELNRSGMVFNSNTRWKKLYEAVRDRSNTCGKVGCITGVDKPRLAFNPKTGKFFSLYADTNNLTQFPEIAYKETKDDIFFDHFYLTYELPEINQKQCFVFKNAILELLHKRDILLYKSLLFRVTEHGVHVFDTHHDFFKSLLYDFWDNTVYQATKSDNFFYPPNMQWYYNSIQDNKRINDFLDKQITEILQGVDQQFIVEQNGKPSNFKHFMTEPIVF